MSNRQFKTVFLGSQNVGKSCIVRRIVQNQYDGKTEPTIGSSFLSKTININGEDITFQLWDTAGQEAFRALTKIYYRFYKNPKLPFQCMILQIRIHFVIQRNGMMIQKIIVNETR